MAQSVLVLDKQVFQGSAGVGGGTFVVTLPTNAAPYTDKTIAIRARAFQSHATGGHQDETAFWQAECSVQNANNVCTFETAIGSTNPMNSNTASYGTSHVQASTTHFNTSTLVFSIDAGNHVVITLTNNAGAGSVAANVTIYVEIEYVGST